MTRRDLTTHLAHCEHMATNQANPPAERALWRALADEIRTYLGKPTRDLDLFGQVTDQPTPHDEEDRDGP